MTDAPTESETATVAKWHQVRAWCLHRQIRPAPAVEQRMRLDGCWCDEMEALPERKERTR